MRPVQLRQSGPTLFSAMGRRDLMQHVASAAKTVRTYRVLRHVKKGFNAIYDQCS
ncbi:hypothetical protein DPMN_189862 [Dreissena polymorpha]|uniref:Uncharacterized protein n=1 Tax=Dreissena polymorpha TaxID=45954 RepID=A0A9D4DT64_DREPO|nr:hypothetical protein DPMN_189862 [Dreissena polymorpha]